MRDSFPTSESQQADPVRHPGVGVRRRRAAISSLVWRIARSLMVVVLIVWSLVPIVWNVMTSLKSRPDIFSVPPTFIFTPDLTGYRQSLGSGTYSVYPALRNSIIISIGTTLLVLVVASLCAYALARFRFKGRKAILYGLLAKRLVPPISGLVPLYMMMFSLRLLDTHLALILIYTALGIPFAVWLLKAFIEAVPQELEQAALVDGCGPMRAFLRITFPLAAPGLAATAAFTFILAWNEFMFAFMFTSTRARPLTVQLGDVRGEEQVLWQLMSAQPTILLIPTIVLGLFLQRYLVKGLTTGALK